MSTAAQRDYLDALCDAEESPDREDVWRTAAQCASALAQAGDLAGVTSTFEDFILVVWLGGDP
jgi:hypothetical protein